MGWKYDGDEKEWVTTDEYNKRESMRGLGCIILIAAFTLPILPARILKWILGYGFLPKIGFGQYFTDLLISVPIYLVIGLVVVLILGREVKK